MVLQSIGISAITVNLAMSPVGPGSSCPLSNIDVISDTEASTFLLADQMLSFSFDIFRFDFPARVKICSRYHEIPRPTTSALKSRYRFTHVVRPDDAAGPCVVLVYIPASSGILAVHEHDTGLYVDPFNGEFSDRSGHVVYLRA